MNRVDTLAARRQTCGIDAKTVGSIAGGENLQRLLSRGVTFSGGLFPPGPLPPLETTTAGKSTEPDRKRNSGHQEDSTAARASVDKFYKSVPDLSITETRSMHRSKSLHTIPGSNKLQQRAQTFLQLRSRKTERSPRVLPSISSRDVPEGQGRERTLSPTKWSRRDAHARPMTTATSTSTHPPLDKSLANAAKTDAPPSCSASRDLASSSNEENVLSARRIKMSAGAPPESPRCDLAPRPLFAHCWIDWPPSGQSSRRSVPAEIRSLVAHSLHSVYREDSDGEEYEEIGNGWSAIFEVHLPPPDKCPPRLRPMLQYHASSVSPAVSCALLTEAILDGTVWLCRWQAGWRQ